MRDGGAPPSLLGGLAELAVISSQCRYEPGGRPWQLEENKFCGELAPGPLALWGMAGGAGEGRSEGL